MTFSTDAIVLKIIKTGESDRLLTLLTRDRGVIKAFAKAADRPKNKLHMSTNLFCYGRFTFYESTKSIKVEECELQETFFDLQKDIISLALAQYFNELMIETAPKETDAGEYLRLLLNSLYFLSKRKIDSRILKSLFEMRLACDIGYMPSLVGCAECGEFESDPMYFNLQTGELFCCGCKAKNAVKYPLDVINAMRHIIYSPLEKLFSLKVNDENINLLNAATEQYLSLNIQKKFKTLDFYKLMV